MSKRSIDKYEVEEDDGRSDGGASDSVVSHGEEENLQLAKRENRAVWGLRMVVFAALIISMILVAVLVYYYISRQEKQAFAQQYHEDADKIVQSISTTLDLTLGGIDALVVNMVAFARAANQSWPYVTISDFAVRAEKLRRLTKALYMNTYAYVKEENRTQWEEYSAIYGPLWVQETFEMQEREGIFTELADAINFTYQDVGYWDVIYDYGEFEKPPEVAGTVGLDPNTNGPFLPKWQTAPLIPFSAPYNWDLTSVPRNMSILTVVNEHKPVLTEAYLVAFENDTESIAQNELEAEWVSLYLETDEEPMEPVSDIYYPILDGAADWININDDLNYTNYEFGGIMSTTIYWRDLIKSILPEGSNGIRLVFENPGCSPWFTYEIYGPSVRFLGVKDAHEPEYEYLEKRVKIDDLVKQGIKERTYTGIPLNDGWECQWTMRVYPSSVMWESYGTNNPIIFALVAVLIFAVTSAAFILYDWWVEARQKVVMKTAVTTSSIVSSFYPKNVRGRIFSHQDEKMSQEMKKKKKDSCAPRFSIKKLRNSSEFMSKDFSVSESFTEVTEKDKGLPIADFFPECTVFFADLAGFTSWSSTREPSQVFMLLEKLYEEFDSIAKRRGVFKIETIGDCYLAVTGLPKPRKTHALIMARFAADCRDVMNVVSRELEPTLGPGTGDLLLRAGMHSGSVTGGVLRGEKCLFTLFGDTVNTASRMESNGIPNRIQVSQTTADLIIEAGKSDWLTKRQDLVTAKGKGQMQTYWVEPNKGKMANSVAESTSTAGMMAQYELDLATKNNGLLQAAKKERMVDWSVSVFKELLQKIAAQRKMAGVKANPSVTWSKRDDNVTPREELAEVIELVPSTRSAPFNHDSIHLSSEVMSQLHDFILSIAQSYPFNSFHSFDHAGHVTMSLKKLLRRILASKTLSDHEIFVQSFGVAKDPLAEFAITLGALAHGVEHGGIPNQQLAKDNSALAIQYKNVSVNEQHAFSVVWDKLMEPDFVDLRSSLFATEHDLARFRQLLLNGILATDIVADPELREMREERWNLALSERAKEEDSDSRRATIILEHVMQVSAVSHTMQPWGIYQKWNHCSFDERMSLYACGQVDEDPSETWYEDVLNFFDNFIIPLGEKLVRRRIFGSYSRELLRCATENRDEWENKGKLIVADMLKVFESEQLEQPILESLVTAGNVAKDGDEESDDSADEKEEEEHGHADHDNDADEEGDEAAPDAPSTKKGIVVQDTKVEQAVPVVAMERMPMDTGNEELSAPVAMKAMPISYDRLEEVERVPTEGTPGDKQAEEAVPVATEGTPVVPVAMERTLTGDYGGVEQAEPVAVQHTSVDDERAERAVPVTMECELKGYEIMEQTEPVPAERTPVAMELAPVENGRIEQTEPVTVKRPPVGKEATEPAVSVVKERTSVGYEKLEQVEPVALDKKRAVSDKKSVDHDKLMLGAAAESLTPLLSSESEEEEEIAFETVTDEISGICTTFA